VLLLVLECAHELPPFLPPTEAANGYACACPCERLLLPSAAEMRCPSCGSGSDLVLIRLSPSEDARIGDSVAVDALPPASLSCPFLPSLAELDLAEDAALLWAAAAVTDEEPKSLSRFLEVSDLVFFLSDLEEEAGEATEAEPVTEVGVRGAVAAVGAGGVRGLVPRREEAALEHHRARARWAVWRLSLSGADESVTHIKESTLVLVFEIATRKTSCVIVTNCYPV
jgi:hypothetical protein